MSIASGQTIRAEHVQATGQRGISLSHIQAGGGSFPSTQYSDVAAFIGGSGTTILVELFGQALQRLDLTTVWAAADEIHGTVILGAYLYVLLHDNGGPANRVYRFDKTNIAAGGTLMTISGTAFGTDATDMTADDSANFYFTNTAGNSSGSNHIISKYTLSGTTLTFSSNTTCGATSANFNRIARVDGSGNFYGYNTGDATFRKYNSSGTLQTTGSGYALGGNILFIYDTCFLGNATDYTFHLIVLP